MQCVNTNLREYQTLKRESGLSDSELSHLVGTYLDTVGRYPYLDEIDGANSEPAIKEDLKLSKDNVTDIENVLQATNTDNINDATLKLNDKYRDKEVEIETYGENLAKVFITERPGLNPKDASLYDPVESEMNAIKKKAIANGTFMKAPNGKSTNLNERQWLQVRTQKFKKWFGDWENDPKNASKVVDGNGEPLVVYHGTDAHWNTFDPTLNIRQKYGNGLYTTTKSDVSNHGEITMALFLNIRKPLDREPLTSEYKKEGFDGVVVPHSDRLGTWYIAPNPNQIKSATDNSGKFSSNNNDITDNEVNSFHYFNEIIDRLNTLYGINVIPITNADLKDSDLGSVAGTAKAFIYNGDIYVNTDIATVDSPVHEFLHILFGSMKYSNRDMYNQIVSSAELFESYQEIALEYPNRTREDVNEEVFVTELAKYLTSGSKDMDSLPNAIKHEIFYNINRILDTMLMGDLSVKCVDLLYLMNLKTLARLVNASTTQNTFLTSLNNAMLSRIMSNKKQELMNEGLLKEECS